MSVSGIDISCRVLGGSGAAYDNALSVSVRSERILLIEAHLGAPTAQKDAAASRIAFPGFEGRRYPVGAERAKALTRLAPIDERARLIDEAERDRPDDPVAPGAVRVFVIDAELRLGSDRRAQHRQRDFIGRETSARRPGQGGR